MSHLSKGRTKIKDLYTLREVILDAGLEIEERSTMHGRYIGNINCEFVVSDGRGGELAIVRTSNDEYEIQMDNWHNSICDVTGQNGSRLTRDYMTAIHKKEAQLLGGVIASEEIDRKGYVFLEVHTP